MSEAFTIEHRAGNTLRAVVSVETAFEDEANLEAVAQVFSALQTPAGTGLNTTLQFEFVNGINTGFVRIFMRIKETFVDNAVKGHIGSESRAGKGAKKGDRGKRLLKHNFQSLFLREEI